MDADFDVLVVGAGFSGLYLLKRLRELGFSVQVLEAGSDVGGTWFWNRYPGLRCDIESMTYSYSFSEELQQEWTWTERYATQPEILRYINHVADRFDLRGNIMFGSKVVAAEYDGDHNLWSLSTKTGERFTARYCVLASGCLSVPNMPTFKGLERFGGEWYHTAKWPREPVSFTGKRVGVLGTGSSGIQSIPIIARQAEHLTVFQRTPHYSIPACNTPMTSERVAGWKANYPALRETARRSPDGDIFPSGTKSVLSVSDAERQAEFEQRWTYGSFGFLSAYSDIVTNEEANRVTQAFFHKKIRETVRDAARAEILSPAGHVGTKRVCLDIDYYETFNRDNVDLVDLRATPFEEITETGIRTSAREVPLDMIIFATGYDAMTGALTRMGIRGRGGRSLAEEWESGPKTYLGLAMAGFPNLFTVNGPQSPSVLANMLTTIEHHVEWIADCLAYAREMELDTVEADQEAQDRWVAHTAEVADATLFSQATSWYLGSNIDGKPRVCLPYVGGFDKYSGICAKVAADGYEGFTLTANPGS